MNIEKVSQEWEKLGQLDPLWAALTTPGKENAWTDEEFIEEGRQEIRDVLKLVESVTPISHKKNALDFGCGPGRLSLGLSGYFESVTGVDISPSMLETAKRLIKDNEHIQLVLNDKPKLSIFPDNTFDLACILHEHC